MFDAYDDWQKDDFLVKYRVPAEGDDLVKQLTQRVIQTSWGAFGGKLDAVTIAAGIEMSSKYDGIQLRREHIYQKPDVPAEGAALPERPKPMHYTDTFDSDGNKTNRAVYLDCSIEPHLTLLETKLAEAIAQRDTARKLASDSDKEFLRLQDSIYAILRDEVSETIDGGGCDSGDPVEFTVEEVGQGIEMLKQRIVDAEAALAALEERYDSAKDEWMEDLRTANEAMGTKNRNRSDWANERAVKAEIQRDAAQKQILDNLIAHGHRMSEQMERAEKAEGAIVAETSHNFNFSGDNGV